MRQRDQRVFKVSVVALLLVLASGVAGCLHYGGSPVTERNYQKIARGMTFQEVYVRLGQAERSEDDWMRWQDPETESGCIIYFREGKVSRKKWFDGPRSPRGSRTADLIKRIDSPERTNEGLLFSFD